MKTPQTLRDWIRLVSDLPDLTNHSFNEIETASMQAYEHGCIPTIYVTNIKSSYVIPIFVGLDYVRYLYPYL